MPNAVSIASSLNGQIRSESRNGREFLVAPVVMAISGVVMNREIIPNDELSHLPRKWNGKPITVQHPGHENGRRSDFIWSPETKVIGTVHNTRYEDEKLKAEFWIDVKAARDAGENYIIQSLQSGESMGVSTGYYCRREEANGVSNGEHYIAIQRDLVPDHVAILQDDHGACSLQDGCGVPRAATRLLQTIANKLGINAGANISHRKLEAELQRKVQNEGNPQRIVSIEDVDRDEGMFVYSADNFGGPIEEDPIRTFRRSFNVDEEGSVELGDEIEEVQAMHVPEFVPVSQLKKGTDMSNNKKKSPWREGIIYAMVNRSDTPFNEDRREELEAMPDDELSTLVAAYNCGDKSSHSEDVSNEESEELKQLREREETRRNKMMEQIQSHPNCKFSEEVLKGMSVEALEETALSLNASSVSNYEGLGKQGAGSEETVPNVGGIFTSTSEVN